MARINFHPAVGFGDLMAGWHVVPQNPIRDQGTPLVPSLQATRPNQILRRGKLAELMPGAFTVPQNPLRDALGGGCSGMGGCGCGGGSYSLNGLGADAYEDPGVISNVTDWLQSPSPFSGVANWVFWPGIALALDFYFKNKRSRR